MVAAKPLLGGYYQTWSATCVWSPEVYCDLADVDTKFDNIFLSFADPQRTYDASDANSIGIQLPATDPAAL